VADEAERGALGMHYTSVPNILKVLNPLFLDELRTQLDAADSNPRTLLNLRKRISRIRVFDPACGSGNFLVIAYKELRKIEAEINRRRGEPMLPSEISKKNFRGIEIRDFAAEIARLALVIAEYQCDVLHRGPLAAKAEFLPLDEMNWIVRDNALRLDWLKVCPPEGTSVKLHSDDLFQTPLDQPEINFENEGGETYICGNPPYKGSKWQDDEQKADLTAAWEGHSAVAKNSDYVTGWFARAAAYINGSPSTVSAFVATNSICQGQHASEFWPAVFSEGCEIRFAQTSFQWNNLAAHNAGVTVVIVGVGTKSTAPKYLYSEDLEKECSVIGPYLIADRADYVVKASAPLGEQAEMLFGNMPRDGGNLFLSNSEAEALRITKEGKTFVRRFAGSEELINRRDRFCLWISDSEAATASKIPLIAKKLAAVREMRLDSRAASTRDFARSPHRFVQIAGVAMKHSIAVPRVSSENRDYLPVDLLPADFIVGDRNFALYDAPLWNMALIASRLHWVWIGTVCVRLRTDFSYSNTLGWNTFPIPELTEHNKADLTRCAQEILLAREVHFPMTIADLYKPDTDTWRMPENLRAAHDRNDETLERIYIGRRFKNDTERLETLFAMYAKMTAGANPVAKRRAGVQQ
jgi:hypothetical protein